MEFEDMQKIWNQEQQAYLYAFDEAALRKSIAGKKNRVRYLASKMECMLMIIAAVTGTILIIDAIADQEPLRSYLAAIPMFLVVAFMAYRRYRRKKRESQFEGTILGDIEQAIFQSQYLESTARTFSLWFLLPAIATMLINKPLTDSSPARWLLIGGTIILSLSLTIYDYFKVQKPRTQRLMKIRDQLEREI